jgi:hypothetical protein
MRSHTASITAGSRSSAFRSHGNVAVREPLEVLVDDAPRELALESSSMHSSCSSRHSGDSARASPARVERLHQLERSVDLGRRRPPGRARHRGELVEDRRR